MAAWSSDDTAACSHDAHSVLDWLRTCDAAVENSPLKYRSPKPDRHVSRRRIPEDRCSQVRQVRASSARRPLQPSRIAAMPPAKSQTQKTKMDTGKEAPEARGDGVRRSARQPSPRKFWEAPFPERSRKDEGYVVAENYPAEEGHVYSPQKKALGLIPSDDGVASRVLSRPSMSISTQFTTLSPPGTETTSLSRPPSPSRKGSPTRSTSPTKSYTDLYSVRPSIQFPPIDRTDHRIPGDVFKLNKDFTHIYRQHTFLPRCLTKQLQHLESDELDETYFDNSLAPATDLDRQTLGELQDLRKKAFNCSTWKKPESSWGVEVVWPMLNLATKLENIDQEIQVQVEDITTTRIWPDTLLPKGTDGHPLGTKKVDYGLYISQNQEQWKYNEAWVSHLELDDQSINQTSAFYTKYYPHLMPVEAKCLSQTDGLVQLGIWMSALRARLEKLATVQEISNTEKDTDSGGDGEKSGNQLRLAFKPLPCILVTISRWELYWCCRGDNGETFLCGPETLGKTTDIKGMYQVLAGLRKIIKYGREQYWPWFRDTILGGQIWDS